MAENEFEKSVQQKMEELKFDPSGEVWKNVEAQIGKESKRRWLLFFFLFLFIFSGGIFWWKQNNRPANVSAKNNTAIPVISNNQYEAVMLKTGKENNNQVQKQLTKIDNIDTKNKTVSISKTRSNIQSTQTVAETFNNHGKKITVRGKAKMKVSVMPADDESESAINNNAGQKSLNDSISSTSVLAGSLKINSDKKLLVNTDSSKKAEATIAANTPKTDSNKTLAKNDKKIKGKWNFAVQLGLGMSATGNNYLSGAGRSPLYSAGTTARYYSPSTVKMSIAFKAGVSAMYHISKRLTVSAGLTYKLYSTVMQTGGKINSNSSFSTSFYSPDTGLSNTYHNYYHFIDVPVEFQYRLGNNSKLPVYVFGGISLSQLIYTNSLQFDYSKGVYYPNNALFYKTGIGLSGGILFDVFQKRKVPLQVGPDFYYSLSSMSGSGLYYNNHYSFIGIRFQKMIGKK